MKRCQHEVFEGVYCIYCERVIGVDTYTCSRCGGLYHGFAEICPTELAGSGQPAHPSQNVHQDNSTNKKGL